MLKELMIPTTLAVAFAVTPFAVADSDGSDGSKADRQQSSWSPEATNMNNDQFDELDANRDGALDEDELNTWGATAAGESNKQKHTDQVLERYDHNNDHRVTMKELQNPPKQDNSDSMQ
jgi:Ca2+-binding EF-hand superfamily protein